MTSAERAEVVARTAFAGEWEQLAHTARVAALLEPHVTHGRHCRCSACAREDWTNPALAPCGMHGSSCPAVYAPIPPATDEQLAVAWLHDVVEDTTVSLDDLRDIGFPETIVAAVDLLTRKPPFSYGEYILDLLSAEGDAAELARTVKLADARDNLARCERAAGVPKWARLAEQRYRPLVGALESMGA